MLTATNDRRAYIRRRSVDVAVHGGTIAHATLVKYLSQVAYARLAVAPSVARCHEWARKFPPSRPSSSISSDLQ